MRYGPRNIDSLIFTVLTIILSVWPELKSVLFQSGSNTQKRLMDWRRSRKKQCLVGKLLLAHVDKWMKEPNTLLYSQHTFTTIPDTDYWLVLSLVRSFSWFASVQL